MSRPIAGAKSTAAGKKMVKMNGSSSGASGNKGGQPANNIWQLMNYSIPRGKCVHKPSMLSPSCPCLRFMLNPLQAASSFACDGCGHHASFHNLKGPEDDEGFPAAAEDEPQQSLVLNGKGNGNSRKRSATVAGKVGAPGSRLQIANIRDEDGSVVELSDGDEDSVRGGKRVRS